MGWRLEKLQGWPALPAPLEAVSRLTLARNLLLYYPFMQGCLARRQRHRIENLFAFLQGLAARLHPLRPMRPCLPVSHRLRRNRYIPDKSTRWGGWPGNVSAHLVRSADGYREPSMACYRQAGVFDVEMFAKIVPAVWPVGCPLRVREPGRLSSPDRRAGVSPRDCRRPATARPGLVPPPSCSASPPSRAGRARRRYGDSALSSGAV